MNFEKLLHSIVSNANWHALWLNTLSYLENCGARKIAACEHPILVKQEVLKHAAEEFRHAHYLKSQLRKITPRPPLDYSLHSMIGGWHTLHYLDKLEVIIARHYTDLLYERVTYAIEKRAQRIYPLYQSILKQHRSKVSVSSIIKEEEGHLKEMENSLEDAHSKEHVIFLEENCFNKWFLSCENEIQSL